MTRGSILRCSIRDRRSNPIQLFSCQTVNGNVFRTSRSVTLRVMRASDPRSTMLRAPNCYRALLGHAGRELRDAFTSSSSGYRCRFQYAIPKASFRVSRLIHLPVFLHLLPIVRAKIGDRCEQMPRKNSYATYQNCCTRLLRISSPQCTVHPTDHCRLRWRVSLT